MALDLIRIKAETENPSRKAEIKRAIAQQERIKFHADTNVDTISSEPFEKFKTFVRSLLPDDKYALTLNLLKFPLPTNEVCESVWVRLSKIFDGRNPAFDYQFNNTQERDDWEWYRQEVLHEPSVWSEKAWEFFKTEINCIMVVDMPEVQEGSRPNPYFYFVPIESVISYKVNRRTENFDWVIYRSGDDRLIAIDDEAYWVFEWIPDKKVKGLPSDKGGKIGGLIARNPHGLGYCPSRFFWSEPLSLSDPDIKKSPLSKELADLDWYLFYCLGKKHLDTYAGYPIYSAYEEECEYSDKEGNVCNHGHLQRPDGTFLTDALGNPVPCPLCKNKKSLAGAGTFVSVPVPEAGQPGLQQDHEKQEKRSGHDRRGSAEDFDPIGIE